MVVTAEDIVVISSGETLLKKPIHAFTLVITKLIKVSNSEIIVAFMRIDCCQMGEM